MELEIILSASVDQLLIPIWRSFFKTSFENKSCSKFAAVTTPELTLAQSLSQSEHSTVMNDRKFGHGNGLIYGMCHSPIGSMNTYEVTSSRKMSQGQHKKYLLYNMEKTSSVYRQIILPF
jgi:hypothetical protein